MLHDSDPLFLACFLQKCEFNMDNLSKPELLTLLSIMEGELEARDLVIEALRVSPDSTHTRTLPYSIAEPASSEPLSGVKSNTTYSELIAFVKGLR